MPVGVEQASSDLWHAAPDILQQMRRHRMEPWAGRRARRSLFGPVDREETRRYVKEELAAIREKDKDKYNFDFENMVPLKTTAVGGYDWEMVAASDVSAAYDFGRLTSALRQHGSARRLDFEHARQSTTPEPESESAPLENMPQPPPSASAFSDASSSSCQPSPGRGRSQVKVGVVRSSPAATRQTTITDYWRNCKRPLSGANASDRASKRLASSSSSVTPSAGSGSA